ncbi:hypothetical protein HYV91_03060 [Candidatus Wolfebacteria bacterium]|nr:hypothetical protein [Candidatus Wolfebacteria bacterium]
MENFDSNSNLTPPFNNPKPGRRYFKFVGVFFLIIAGVFILYTAVFWLWRAYESWQAGKALEKYHLNLKQVQEEDYRRAMADTYGGKTPQETLKMYIEAVEKGDYELASKYFIGDYQRVAKIDLDNSSRAKISNLVSLLQKSLKSSGAYYSRDYMPGGKEFIIENPIYIRMRLYPNGIWKIIEI